MHVEFDPFLRSAATTFLMYIKSPKVLAESPKLAVTQKLQPRSVGTAKTKMTFADDSHIELDLTKYTSSEVLERIVMENGRVTGVERTRGKPFT